MKARYNLVETLAHSIHTEYSCKSDQSIDLESIIAKLKINLLVTEMDQNLSGIAVIKEDAKYILINSNHRSSRQNFTMAHELGHLLLHSDRPINYSRKTAYYFRDDASSKGEQWREVEANYFAACLLMPKNCLIKSISSHGFSSELGEEEIAKLATEYKVSELAMGIRLQSLQIK